MGVRKTARAGFAVRNSYSVYVLVAKRALLTNPNLLEYIEGRALRVLVAYTSTGVLLWKAAGAHECASGKFFSLRRFRDQSNRCWVA